ncbi:MAG: group 1 glycosyl transferase [Candidatus Saganbacteria bacterium]|uniref:Group 1 glycosyl transferase n=1 Tax=Candidatus Saganbacteria bacterium TaxID=2575572 RepID=A0A833L2J0_UNCSA|nr:MAG: group 1 glycosyl transferase [Candidatus Saganbacteria bacterium]
MKIALVHDYLIQMGGAERVVSALHKIFSNAPIYTAAALSKKLSDELKDADIKTSFLQNWPYMDKEFRMYFLLYPFAFSSFNLSQYDLIFSSSSAYAKGINKRKGQIHVCYCHTPARFIWMQEEYLPEKNNPLLKFVLALLTPYLKSWDLKTADNVDHYIANSNYVKERIKKIYKRDSVVIYPPVNCARFKTSTDVKGYFLILSRLLHYKRIDIAVKAFNKLKIPLKIAGEGPAIGELKSIANSNIEFMGYVSEQKAVELLSECKALVFPGREDFGIIPLEAAASGRPTIAFNGGGARETTISGKTGVLFNLQNEESLINAVNQFNAMSFNSYEIIEHAKKFDISVFEKKIRGFINEIKIL